MTTLEKEIEDLKKRHADIECEIALQVRYKKYKALKDTIECHVNKYRNLIDKIKTKYEHAIKTKKTIRPKAKRK